MMYNLYSGKNIIAKAVILHDRDRAPSFIGTNGLVYTDLLDTYGDSCIPNKIVPSAIQLPLWGKSKNLAALAAEFADLIPDEDSYSYNDWSDEEGQVLLKDLLSALKNGQSIAGAKPAVPAEVECWQQETTDEVLKELAKKMTILLTALHFVLGHLQLNYGNY